MCTWKSEKLQSQGFCEKLLRVFVRSFPRAQNVTVFLPSPFITRVSPLSIVVEFYIHPFRVVYFQNRLNFRLNSFCTQFSFFIKPSNVSLFPLLHHGRFFILSRNGSSRPSSDFIYDVENLLGVQTALCFFISRNWMLICLLPCGPCLAGTGFRTRRTFLPAANWQQFQGFP